MRLDLRKLRLRQPKLVATHLCLLFGSRESRHYARANTFMGPDPRTPDMLARLTQIDAEIADVERRTLLENKTIVSAPQKGTDTVSQEKQVGLLNKVLQVKNGCRR